MFRSGTEREETAPHVGPNPDRRGRGSAYAPPALQSRSRRLCGRRLRAWRRGRAAPQGNPARPRGDRLDAAGAFGHRACPTPAGQAGDAPAADHHAHRARRGRRSASAGSRPAPTTTSSSPSRCRSCSPASARCCAARSPSGSRPRSRPATSSSTATPSACRARAARVPLGPTEFRLLEFLLENSGPRVLARGSSWTRSGAATSTSTSAPSMSMSAAMRKALNRGPHARPDPHGPRRRLRAQRPLRQDSLTPEGLNSGPPGPDGGSRSPYGAPVAAGLRAAGRRPAR